MIEEMKTLADMLIGMSKNDWDNLKMSVDITPFYKFQYGNTDNSIIARKDGENYKSEN